MSHESLMDLADRGLRACSTLQDYERLRASWTRTNDSQLRWRDNIDTQAEPLARRCAEDNMRHLRRLVDELEALRATEQ